MSHKPKKPNPTKRKPRSRLHERFTHDTARIGASSYQIARKRDGVWIFRVGKASRRVLLSGLSLDDCECLYALFGRVINGEV